MAYSYKYSEEYNYRSNYKYRARVGIEIASKTSTKYVINWVIEVQAQHGYLYGMAVIGSGACSGYSDEGYLTSSPGSTWKTVASVSHQSSYSRKKDKQTVNFTAKAYGKTVRGIGSAGGAGKTVNYPVTIPALETYKITFDKNGGTGGPTSQTKYYGQALTITSKKPTYKGHTFVGWYTAKSGGSKYGSTIPASTNKNLTLYAHWNTITYDITYSKNTSDTVSNMPDTQPKSYDSSITLSDKIPIRNNYKFIGWNTNSAATTASFSPKQKYTNNANLSLHAIWKYNIYTISYNLNGGSSSSSINNQTAVENTPLSLYNGNGINPPSGKYLDSWNTQANGGGTKYGLGQTYPGSTASSTPIILYAQYKNSYTGPLVDLNGGRIDSNGDASKGGKRVKLSYTWTAARPATGNYNRGTFVLQYSDNVDTDEPVWNDEESITGYTFTFDGTTLKYGEGSFILSDSYVSEHDGRSFRIKVTDDVTTGVEPTITDVFTIPEREDTRQQVTIISNSFNVSRESSSSSIVNFDFQWTPYYDGNDYYIDSTVFTVKAIPFLSDTQEEETPISVNVVGIYDNETKIGQASGFFTNIPITRSARFYITNVTSTKNTDSESQELDEDIVYGIVNYGNFIININSTGEGISLFGVANNLKGFSVGEDTFLHKNLTIDGTLTAKTRISALNGLQIANYMGIRWNKSDGNDAGSELHLNTSNNFVIGYPQYSKKIGNTEVYGDKLYLYANGGVHTNGYFYINNHNGYIGQAFFNKGEITAAPSSTAGSDFVKQTKITFGNKLGKGVWIITATLHFASNATGSRVIRIYINNTGYESTNVRQSAVSGGETRMQTTLITDQASDFNVYVGTYQSSGANLKTQWWLRAVRIA